MTRLLGIRIVLWYFKLFYIVGVWLVGFPINAILGAVGAPDWAVYFLGTFTTLGGILLGARWFRGSDELVEPPRPWWKMTARRRLSRVVGVLALIGVLSLIATALGAALGIERAVETVDRVSVLGMIDGGVFYAAIAFLYLNSAARLPTPDPRPVPETFKPNVKLD